jgi:hypothetical protein
MIGGNAHAAQFNNFTLANSGSLTFANSSFVGANGNVLRLQANNSGTITMQAATPGLRTAAVSLNQIQYNTTNGSAITYTHAANIQGLGILQLFAAGSLTVTNGYGLLLNDLNEYGYPSTGAGALSITNRWGIYQDSTTDSNYLGGSVLIGTTTNAGYKTDINGTLRAVSTVTLSSLAGTGTRMVVADATGILSTQAIPGGGGISGSGTTNYVAKFTGASSIGDSSIFDNGTNVGIGTASPAAILDIQAATGFVKLTSTTGTNRAYYQAVNSGGAFNLGLESSAGGAILSTSPAYSLVLTNYAANPLILGVNSTEAVRIFSNQNVAIGTTTNTGYKFTVRGGDVSLGSNSILDWGAGNARIVNSTYDLTFQNYNGVSIVETARITGAGNVGIGTTAPTERLDVTSTLSRIVITSTTNSNNSALYFNAKNSVGTNVQGGVYFIPAASPYLSLSGNNSGLHLNVTAGGNILLGTTTDSGQRLQVAGTARIFGTALPHLLIEQTAATGNVELQFSATDATYPAIIRSKAAQSIAFKDGTNSNLDIYSAGQLSIGGGGAPFGSTNTLTVLAGTAPTATASDCFTLYSKDITAGNAAPHFITENGAIVKIYQETTSVAAAAFTANSGTAINDASTFDGYTLRQIVKALRNLGILQ